MIAAAAFLVAAAAGALARAVIGQRLNHPAGAGWGTLAVNLSGSFALGLLAGAAPEVATVLGTGFLGAYTTFSSFARDVATAIERRQHALAASYLVATIAGSIGAAWLALAWRG